ncbi:putative plant lipid transfer protein/Par allergen [Helianthus anomalus]
MKGVVIVVLAMLAIVGFMVQPNEAITCEDVDHLLAPCLSYLKTGGTPIPDCCNGLTALQAKVSTRSDRQSACNCAKKAAIEYQVREDTAKALPDKCGITISVPISATVDCSTVQLYASYK